MNKVGDDSERVTFVNAYIDSNWFDRFFMRWANGFIAYVNKNVS